MCVSPLHNAPLLLKVGSADPDRRCSRARVTLWELPRSLTYERTKPKSADTLIRFRLHRAVESPLSSIRGETRVDFKASEQSGKQRAGSTPCRLKRECVITRCAPNFTDEPSLRNVKRKKKRQSFERTFSSRSRIFSRRRTIVRRRERSLFSERVRSELTLDGHFWTNYWNFRRIT